jgi:hypothetical protein
MSLAALLALVTKQIKGIIESRLSNVDILTFVYGRVKCGFWQPGSGKVGKVLRRRLGQRGKSLGDTRLDCRSSATPWLC